MFTHVQRTFYVTLNDFITITQFSFLFAALQFTKKKKNEENRQELTTLHTARRQKTFLRRIIMC